jgi:DNA-binding response OmpR family regulator
MDRATTKPSKDPLASPGAKRLPDDNKSKLILVVDDDADTVNLVASIGRRAGYTVFGAKSGEECISMLWRVKPRLIFLDVSMGGLNGFETCRQIRRDVGIAHVPIAFLTGHNTVDDVNRCVAVGGDDFIVKPFSGTHLAERIKFLTSRRYLLAATRMRRARDVARYPIA